jgi:hypothetical protein
VTCLPEILKFRILKIIIMNKKLLTLIVHWLNKFSLHTYTNGCLLFAFGVANLPQHCTVFTHIPRFNYALIKVRRTAFSCVVLYCRLHCTHALVQLAVCLRRG